MSSVSRASACAKQHGSQFRRVIAVVADDDGELISLDLKNPPVTKRLESASNEPDVRRIFADFGGAY